MKLIIIFTVLSIINVIFSTVRSILTIKGNKTIASLSNAGYFAFYNIVLIYSVADFCLWQKCLVTFTCNLIGVYIVKLIEEKKQKEKMWKIEITVPTMYAETIDHDLKSIPHSFIKISEKHTLFNFYCATKSESEEVKAIVEEYGARYFASESKIL